MGTCALSQAQYYGSMSRYGHSYGGRYYYPQQYGQYGIRGRSFPRFYPGSMYGSRSSMYGPMSRGMMNYPNSNNQYNSGGSSSYSKYIPSAYSHQGSGNGGQSSSYSKYIPSSYKHYWSKYYPMSSNPATTTLMAMNQEAAPEADVTTLVGSMSFVPDFASSFVPSFGSGYSSSQGPMAYSPMSYSPMMPYRSMMPGYGYGAGGSSPMSFMCSFCGNHMNPFSMYECPPWCMQGGMQGGYPY